MQVVDTDVHEGDRSWCSRNRRLRDRLLGVPGGGHGRSLRPAPTPARPCAAAGVTDRRPGIAGADRRGLASRRGGHPGARVAGDLPRRHRWVRLQHRGLGRAPGCLPLRGRSGTDDASSLRARADGARVGGFRRGGLAWVVSCAILLALTALIGDLGRAEALLGHVAVLSVVLVFWLVTGPVPATVSAHRRLGTRPAHLINRAVPTAPFHHDGARRLVGEGIEARSESHPPRTYGLVRPSRPFGSPPSLRVPGRFCTPQFASASTTGPSRWPRSVSRYRNRGGCSL